jgi:hypothetical protein
MRLLLNKKMKKPQGCDLGTPKWDLVGELLPDPEQSPVCGETRQQ